MQVLEEEMVWKFEIGVVSNLTSFSVAVVRLPQTCFVRCVWGWKDECHSGLIPEKADLSFGLQ